jgi:glycosyltransferase involved in cell wall biosynthesis
MRIVQVIDSLEIGGAERMAVNFANALSTRIEFSGLVATRAQGSLTQHIAAQVKYLFLERSATLDFGAVMRLRRYCIENRVDHIHAHSSSYFISVLVKILLPRVKVIWHDHNGMSEFLNSRESYALKLASTLFTGIVVVNQQLKVWARRELFCKKVIYLANFTNAIKPSVKNSWPLLGERGHTILCLANLRQQKDHFMLLEVAGMLKTSHPKWTFHLVGKDFDDDYSEQVKRRLREMNLQEHVFIYGSREDVPEIIQQADIAILTSKSEGLPVALLEFGLHKKAVVVTGVGEIPQIITNGHNGCIVASGDSEAFYQSLIMLIADEELRQKYASALYETIIANNSEDAVIGYYLKWLSGL